MVQWQILFNQSMGAAKPSKKQRGKKNAVVKAKKAKATPGNALAAAVATSKSHVKFDDKGEQVTKAPVTKAPVKKRARGAVPPAKATPDAAKEGGGRSDRSPEAVQQARYYLEQWRRRAEPTPEGELPWKFKVRACVWLLCVCVRLPMFSLIVSCAVQQKVKQMWILQWMYEADVVPKSLFAIVLDYLDGIEGQARQVRLFSKRWMTTEWTVVLTRVLRLCAARARGGAQSDRRWRAGQKPARQRRGRGGRRPSDATRTAAVQARVPSR